MRKTVLVLSVVLATQMFAKDGQKEVKKTLPTKSHSTIDFSYKTLNKACDKGSLDECNNLGVILKHGRGVKKDLERATKIFERICNKGHKLGCENLGFIYYERKTEKDYKKAAPILKEVCELNSYPACTALGYMHYMGLGVEKNRTKSMELYRISCDGRFDPGCTYIELIEKEKKKAKK